MNQLSDLVTSLSNTEESISVSDLNNLSKVLLENNLPTFWVKGEISGLKTYSHAYFDLKDEHSKISCVIFASKLAKQECKPANGQQVEVRGKVSIYSPSGSYQINIEQIRRIGVGELFEAYHRLLNKLKAEGLFEASHKKALPVFPQTVGVITSREGAVIRDVVTTLKRRMPGIHIIVYHTLVQGQGAGMHIAKAIKVANARNETDVLIVCRGGGSMQDLWCFNEEVVARTVYESKIPLISAVGHETDTTIIDFVADLRAPTPTAAAELVAQSRLAWNNLLHKFRDGLDDKINAMLNYRKQQLDVYQARLQLLNPLTQLQAKRKRIEAANMRLRYAATQIFRGRQSRLMHLATQLKLVNPSSILARGYAIVKNKQGKVIYRSQELAVGESIDIMFGHDSLQAVVTAHPMQS